MNPKKLNFEKNPKNYRSKSTISERNGKFTKIISDQNNNKTQKKSKIISKGNIIHKDSV